MRTRHEHAKDNIGIEPADALGATLSLEWLYALLGLAPSTHAMLTDDSASANLLGLACARYRMLNGHAEGVIYCSERTDPALEDTMRILGFADDSVRRLPSSDSRLDGLAVARKVRQDRAAGLCPFCVVANAGFADTGAVDNLIAISRVCKAEGLWLHVDGSHGGGAAITKRGSKLLRGLVQADSFALDLQEPFEQPDPLGCLLLRDAEALRETSHLMALRGTPADATAPTLEVKAHALSASLRRRGAEAFREEIDRRMQLADLAESQIRAQTDWQVMSRSQLAIVTFRFKPHGVTADNINRLQARLAIDGQREGLALLSTAWVKGHLALRMCTVGTGIFEDDVYATVQWLIRRAAQLDWPSVPARRTYSAKWGISDTV